MKTVNLLTLVIFLFCGTSLAQTNWMDWRYGKPGIQVVTNAPSRAEHAALSNTVAGISSVSLGTVTSLIAEAVGPLASTNTVNATNALFSAWFSGLQSRTSYWDTAYSWGDWHSAVAGKLDSAATNGWETGSHASFLTSAPPQSVVSVNGQTGAVVITAAGIGALTNETDLAALRTYHYGSPEIVESPAEWFQFDGVGTITAFNWAEGRENVVIPWAIGGVPVTTMGANAFQMSGVVSVIAPQAVTMIGNGAFSGCFSLTSINLPQVTSIGNGAFFNCGLPASVSLPQVTSIGDGAFSGCFLLASINLPQVTSIGDGAFNSCNSLTSVTIPQVTSIGDGAFAGCSSLTAVHMGQNAPAEAIDVFYGILPPPTVYVTNPNATGWGVTWNGRTVVRLPLHTDSLTLGGVTHTNWPSADVSGLATTQSVNAVAGDLELAAITLNNHTANGTIGSDAHASSAEKSNWNGKLSASGGTASNLTVTGFIALPQTAPTNLVLRLVCSNEHIIVQEVYP